MSQDDPLYPPNPKNYQVDSDNNLNCSFPITAHFCPHQHTQLHTPKLKLLISQNCSFLLTPTQPTAHCSPHNSNCSFPKTAHFWFLLKPTLPTAHPINQTAHFLYLLERWLIGSSQRYIIGPPCKKNKEPASSEQLTNKIYEGSRALGLV